MALIGPSPTVASVSSLVRSVSGSELFEVLDEVLQFTDGLILTNLVANTTTRPKIVSYFTPEKLSENFPLLRESSDPHFVALSWLADEVEELRSPILEIISNPPMSRSSLTVYTRLMSKQKLDPKNFSDDVLTNIFSWLQISSDTTDQSESVKETTNWLNLATILIKSAAPSHEKLIISYVEDAMKGDDSEKKNIAYALTRTAHDSIPHLVNLIEKSPLPTSPTNDFYSMLSVLCNNKENREKIQVHLGDITAKSADEGNVAAGIVDAKILAGTTSQTGDVEKSAKRLDKLSLDLFETNIDETSLEGLACTAFLASVRDRIAGQKSEENAVIPQLVSLLKTHPATSGYAILAILVELSRYPIKPTKEEQEKTKLRIQAMGKSVFDREENNDVANENIKFHARQQSGKICDQVIASSLLTWISTNASKLSLASHEQLAYLLRELTAHQEKHRRETLSKQGAAVIAMYLWALDKPERLSPHIRSVAAATIAKILATVDPYTALTDKVAKPVVVPALCEQIHNDHSDRRNLDTFEALRALTNLASIDDNQLRNVVTRHSWPKMTEALNSDFLQIRRSSLELICNLMMVPRSAEHFLQHTAESDSLLSLLGQSVVVDDPESRLAAAGALAILSEWETAPECIGHNRNCIEGMTRALGLFPKDEALLLRVLMALNTIIKVTSRDLDDEVVERIVFNEGMAHLEELVDTLDPVAHNEVAKLVLQCIRLLAEYKRKNPNSSS